MTCFAKIEYSLGEIKTLVKNRVGQSDLRPTITTTKNIPNEKDVMYHPLMLTKG